MHNSSIFFVQVMKVLFDKKWPVSFAIQRLGSLPSPIVFSKALSSNLGSYFPMLGKMAQSICSVFL